MGVKVKEWKGKWWIFVNHQGRRRAKRCASKKAAQLAADKIDAALKLGQDGVLDADRVVAPKVPTFREYAGQWLRSEAALRLKPITVERYGSMLDRHILPAFGDRRLPDITRAAVKTQVAAWATNGKVRGTGPLRASSVKLLIATVRTILNAALDDELIQANPAVRLGRLIGRTAADVEAAPDPFTAEEVRLLLDTLERDWPEWRVFFLTMARTGLRVGECLSLQRDDLDFARGSLWVRRTWTRGRLGSPKGNRSRAVDLSDQLVRTLETWGSVQDAEAALKGQAASQWVFGTPTGEPYDDRWLRWHIWRPLLRRAGLRHRGMHQVRHSYATLMIAAGAHPKYIQGQLGHASFQVTMDVYGHLFPGTFGRLVNALDDATGRNPGATSSDSLRADL